MKLLENSSKIHMFMIKGCEQDLAMPTAWDLQKITP